MWHVTWHVWCKKDAGRLLYRTAHVIRCEMGIVLGLLNSLMAKKLPHGEEVYTIHAHMASEGMAQRVNWLWLNTKGVTEQVNQARAVRIHFVKES